MIIRRTWLTLPVLFLIGGCCTVYNPGPGPTTQQTAELPPVEQQLAALDAQELPVAATSAAFIKVRFEGLMLHVTARTPRAVLPRDNDHVPELEFNRGVTIADINAVFPASCSALPCTVTLPPYVALQIVQNDNSPSVNTLDTKSEPAFDALVPALGPFAVAVHGDVSANFPPTGGAVAAFMELNGGTIIDAGPTPCRGRFFWSNGRVGEWQYFDQDSTLRMVFAGQALLQVKKTAAGPWESIPLQGNPTIILRNRAKMPGDHFHLLSNLVTGAIEFPMGVEKEPGCIVILGDVPGCGNTQFP
ncbi:MAG: hypothetical protein ACJ74H_08275 [Thermoanaerobaculia bacterium]